MHRLEEPAIDCHLNWRYKFPKQRKGTHFVSPVDWDQDYPFIFYKNLAHTLCFGLTRTNLIKSYFDCSMHNARHTASLNSVNAAWMTLCASILLICAQCNAWHSWKRKSGTAIRGPAAAATPPISVYICIRLTLCHRTNGLHAIYYRYGGKTFPL